ncbi:cupin domain-containing protein [Novosphingobium colocasiae]|uniref:Transcriptional regulator n=1 Tax=Novosphingobium colocasiae TaxID=1256513 RepID=A0A918PA99_9SPHN|nr:cupin domain-containing protein [Novosphingobium colocasiae]GGY93827.1 transcriptional regulator [Novosphingobium colocasiae]
MPRIDIEALPQTNATGYPAPFDKAVSGRWYRRLAPAAGLTAMGASHVVLKPGAWSSQRHWHRGEDELLVMLTGEAVLIENSGRTVIQAGDVCAWPADSEDGHHLVNESEADCSFIAISAGPDNGGDYPDIDMIWNEAGYAHKDGTPYETERPA